MKKKITLLLLKTIALFPLSWLYVISDLAYLIFYHLIKYRRKVVNTHLRESFPEKTPEEIKKIEKQFYHYLGDQIVETLKLLHISDKQLAKRVKVTNPEIVNASTAAGKNVVLFIGHYANWEWVQQISRHFRPETFLASIYHPLSSKLWDNVFIEIRSRWGAHIIPQTKAPRVLLNSENFPWICGFIADQWTWQHKKDNYVDFLNHKTWFITGPEELGKHVGADFFYLEMVRLKRGYYQINFHKLDYEYSASKAKGSEGNETEMIDSSYPYSRQFWHLFEKTIIANPSYWLWSHKRWKE